MVSVTTAAQLKSCVPFLPDHQHNFRSLHNSLTFSVSRNSARTNELSSTNFDAIKPFKVQYCHKDIKWVLSIINSAANPTYNLHGWIETATFALHDACSPFHQNHTWILHREHSLKRSIKQSQPSLTLTKNSIIYQKPQNKLYEQFVTSFHKIPHFVSVDQNIFTWQRCKEHSVAMLQSCCHQYRHTCITNTPILSYLHQYTLPTSCNNIVP